MIADGLTKALKREAFNRFVAILYGVRGRKDALNTIESTNRRRAIFQEETIEHIKSNE
jgi:hypothetical protein